MSNIILAIDTSINYCSVAIKKNKKTYMLSDYCNKEHAIKILPMLQKILSITKIKINQIDYITFSKGPGNFTGIRIAAGIAQNLSLSLKIPIIGISTLAIMAQQAWRKYRQKNILVAMQATAHKIYWAEYIKDNQMFWIGEKTESLLNFFEITQKIKDLKSNWSLVGNAWNQINCINFLNLKKTQIVFPKAKDAIPLSIFHIKNKKFLHPVRIRLNYLNNIK